MHWRFAAIELQELSEVEALALLGHFTPQSAAAESKEARNLLQAVGRLPLAITLVGRYLQKAARSGQPRRLREAFERLNQAEVRLQLTQPQSPLESKTDAPLSLLAVIGVSDEALDDKARQTLRALSLFPPKSNTFSEEAALAVAAASTASLDMLVDYGLMEASPPDRYALHQTIADYARLKLADTAAPARFAEHFTRYAEAHLHDYDGIQQEFNNLLIGLELAHKTNTPAMLIRGANALFRFLEVRGLYETAGVHLSRAERAARELKDETGLAIVLLNRGRTLRLSGQTAQAEALYQEGLMLARQVNHRDLIGDLTMDLGAVATMNGNYAQAESFYQESLSLSREMGNQERIARVLANLSALEFNRGNYTLGETYSREGLAAARQIGDIERISHSLLMLGVIIAQRGDAAQAEQCLLESLDLARVLKRREFISQSLANLGSLSAARGDFQQAEVYLQEGLTIARELKAPDKISLTLVNLGEVAGKRGNFAAADAYYQEGLSLARELNYSWLITGILNEWGELQLQRRNFEAAASLFGEALQNGRESGNQEITASALYGLARIAQATGSIVEARRQGQESLTILEAISHHRSKEVQEWLTTLSS